jgi:hypothetical protein
MKNQIQKAYHLTDADLESIKNNMKLEYFREGGKFVEEVSDDGMLNVRWHRGRKRGAMFAALHPNDNTRVIVGWSMVHRRYDKFDRENAFYVALGRALAWSDDERYLRKEDSKEAFPTFVPASTTLAFQFFLNRAKSYYKDKTMPSWTKRPLLVRSQSWQETLTRCNDQQVVVH